MIDGEILHQYLGFFWDGFIIEIVIFSIGNDDIGGRWKTLEDVGRHWNTLEDIGKDPKGFLHSFSFVHSKRFEKTERFYPISEVRNSPIVEWRSNASVSRET